MEVHIDATWWIQMNDPSTALVGGQCKATEPIEMPDSRNNILVGWIHWRIRLNLRMYQLNDNSAFTPYSVYMCNSAIPFSLLTHSSVTQKSPCGTGSAVNSDSFFSSVSRAGILTHCDSFWPNDGNNFIFTARRYASAVLAVLVCPSVCLSVCLSVRLSVCHKPVLYRNGNT